MKLEITIVPMPVRRGESASVRVVVASDVSIVKDVTMAYPPADIDVALARLDRGVFGGEQVIPKKIPPGEYELLFTAKDALGKAVSRTYKAIEVT